MKFQEYREIGKKYGLTLYNDIDTDIDLGYRIGDTEFISVCGYRSDSNVSWPAGSVIFYNENGFWNGEWFDTVEKLEERILEEIEKKKAIVNEYRIRRMNRDFV